MQLWHITIHLRYPTNLRILLCVQAAAKLIVFPSSFDQLRLNHLRSLNFIEADNDEVFLLKSQRRCFLELLLQAVPQLVQLKTNWDYVMTVESVFGSDRFVNSPLLNLRHLCLSHPYRYGNQWLSEIIVREKRSSKLLSRKSKIFFYC